jgi:hypothetical protein
MRPSGEAFRPDLRRPRWATVLAVLMLLAGARLFFGGLTDLRRVVTGQPTAEVRLDGLADANQELLIRGQLALEAAVERAHPVGATVQAAARFLLSLLLLYAVVAVFSGDARARQASVAAAFGGLGLYFGSGVYLLLVVRQGVAAAVPTLIDVAAHIHTRIGDAPPAPADLAKLTSTLVVHVPLLTVTLGFLFSALLLVYFGGRRGRLFYNRGEQAHHG